MMLGVEELVVHRGGAVVVDRLSFAVAESGWVGLIGANGSGKTTLLRAIAGRLPATSGRILIDGADLAGDRGARAARIGFAVECGFLPDDLTPRELFAIGAEADQVWERPELAPLGQALRIADIIDMKCGSLSAGMRQRAAIFAAFLDLPGIVILDEPFNWLDPVTAYDVKQVMRALVEECGTILITSLHDVATLTACCARGILLSAGRIALDLDAAELAAGRADAAAFENLVVARLRGAA